jgi:hypothetical protein
MKIILIKKKYFDRSIKHAKQTYVERTMTVTRNAMQRYLKLSV